MAKDSVEIERKYDVDVDTTMPSLGGVPGVERVEPAVVTRMDATYFDTRDLALVGAGITLRRRVGGEDQGWHLKLPGVVQGRTEIHLPLARGIRTVPHEIHALLRGVAGLAEDPTLRAVARLRTTRTVRLLRDEDGRALAEVCDDEVSARTFRIVDTGAGGDGEPVEQSWREWEVELVDGDEDLLGRVEEVLLAAGARESEHGAKLRRALADAAPPPPPSTDDLPDEPSPRQVVQARITEQARLIVQLDPAVRRDSDDAVHQMRVAARRLRSALATYRPLLQRERTEPLREELRHLGRLLSDARDLEVLDERFVELLEGEGWAEHPFGAHLLRELRAEREAAHEGATSELDEPRHQELLSELSRIAEQAPWAAGPEPGWDEVLKRVRKDHKKMRRRMGAADDAESHDERVHLLHETRKAAKRLRYAAEALTPAYGKDAEKLAKSAKALQSHLGDIQDAGVARDRLDQAAASARDDGVDVAPADPLRRAEQEEIEAREAELPKVWKKASRKKRRAWLST